MQNNNNCHHKHYSWPEYASYYEGSIAYKEFFPFTDNEIKHRLA